MSGVHYNPIVEAAKSLVHNAPGPLPSRPALIGQKFTHYKGGMYELLYLAMRDDTPELMAVYCNANGQVFVRKAHEFFGYVEIPGNATPVLRFKPWTEPKK